jgi:hypothetical protein
VTNVAEDLAAMGTTQRRTSCVNRTRRRHRWAGLLTAILTAVTALAAFPTAVAQNPNLTAICQGDLYSIVEGGKEILIQYKSGGDGHKKLLKYTAVALAACSPNPINPLNQGLVVFFLGGGHVGHFAYYNDACTPSEDIRPGTRVAYEGTNVFHSVEPAPGGRGIVTVFHTATADDSPPFTYQSENCLWLGGCLLSDPTCKTKRVSPPQQYDETDNRLPRMRDVK